jgi:DnaK suppressor protein
MVRRADDFEDDPDDEKRLIQQPGPLKPIKEDAVGEGAVEPIAENAEPGAVHKQEELSQEVRPRVRLDAKDRTPRGSGSRKSGNWSPDDLRKQREALVTLRQRLREDMQRLRGDAAASSPQERGETSSLPMHLADAGTEAFDQARDLGVAEQQSEEIQSIDRAIDRMEAGTYGQCDECGGAIDRARLEALPHAALCYDCQRLRETR